MIVDGENLIVSFDEEQDDIEEFYTFIKPRLEYIESITVKSDVKITSALLLQLLASIKKSKPSIKVSIFEDSRLDTQMYGSMQWSHYE